jgi:hypothetical protein
MPRNDYNINLPRIRFFDKEPSHTYWHVLEGVSFLGRPTEDAKLKKALAAAPEGVRLFWLSQLIEGPVENGGFRAYFARRPPLWVHRLAKQAILQFGCPEVVQIIDEAERYMASLRSKRLTAKEWGEATGPVGMEKATNRIHRRFFRSLSKLHVAREKYLEAHPERFAKARTSRPRPNPILAEREKRNFAARIRR